jgi:colanic acid/amylovoran biosynthesis protein
MRILITNAVPLNGGDEALLRGLLLALSQSLPQARFTVLTSATMLARRYLPDLDFDDDLGYATPPVVQRVLTGLAAAQSARGRTLAQWLRRVSIRFSPLSRGRILGLYRGADAVFAAPGGYLHDHYRIEERLNGLETALELGKPLFLVGHSLGPFPAGPARARVRSVLDRAARIVVREKFSLAHLEECGIRGDRVTLAADLAFALAGPPRGPRPEPRGGRYRIGVCFRRWPLRDSASAEQTAAKAVALCEWLLARPGTELVFYSTCQGIPGYVDDADFAARIVGALPPELASRCAVDRGHRSPDRLVGFLSDLDVCLSMRMHGCILAMLAGTPALAFDYEPKSAGLYEMMGLDPYHVDFRAEIDGWLAAAERFLLDAEGIRSSLPARVAAMSTSARDAVASAAKLIAGGAR